MTYSQRKYHYPHYAAHGPLPFQGSLPFGVVAPFLWPRSPPFPLTKPLGAPCGMAPRIWNVSDLPYSIFDVLGDKKVMRPNLGRITRPDDRAGNMSLTYRLYLALMHGLFEKFLQLFFCPPKAFGYVLISYPLRICNFFLRLVLEVILQEPPALGFRQAGVDSL